jgi:uncharacterized protein (UPF0548 family)
VSLREVLGRADCAKLLDELPAKELNFDPDRRAEFIPDYGWRFDFYRQPLPGEPPGPPVPDGSWETARLLMRDYEFVEPSIVRAFFRADAPLEGRNMLLEARFLGLHFYLGVRVVAVIDETREEDGRRARVWGWSYATLEDHLEMGQMDYEVWKWLDAGGVEFRIHAFSRVAHISNPLVRLGFHLFGRGQQKRFARLACERMARLNATSADRGAFEALRTTA